MYTENDYEENMLRKGATGKHIDKNAKLFFAQSSQKTYTHNFFYKIDVGSKEKTWPDKRQQKKMTEPQK